MPRGDAPRALDLGDGLWVIVSTVPAREYESGMTPNVADVEWLAECGVAHHDVIVRAARSRSVAPFRLLTLFRTENRVLEEASRLRPRIERALDSVDDRREWVVRVAAVSPAAPSSKTRLPRSGTAYLMKRAERPRATRPATPAARRAARALIADLEGYADRVVQRPSAAAHVLYDGALLVSRACERDLGNAVRQWAPRLTPVGCRVSLTGPWPPYSFVSLDGRRSKTSDDRA
jgi:hypothetical protein